jgi:hypothetical protein
MNATFPMRTGDISYQIGLSPPAATGSWSVSLGFLDQNENSWNISGMSGKIYDNSGYLVGGYNSNVATTLRGVVSGGEYSLYQDDVLLSNTQNQEEGDYNMVSISGTYVGGYLPDVSILGDNVANDSQVQTVPFWKKENDDRVLFVTENATADLGFIQAVSGMGFFFETGLLTGAGAIQADQIDISYGLVIFGAATSSGLYHSGDWNTLNVPMMSLNSHLVCSGNLNWSRSTPKTSESLTAASTGQAWVFPGFFEGPGQNGLIWAEDPILGWERFYFDLWESESYLDMHLLPYVSGVGDANRSIRFQYNVPSAGNTKVTFQNGHTATRVYTTDVRPVFTQASFPQSIPATGLPHDLYLTFTDVSGVTGVETTLSNTLGGTGTPADSMTGTVWGLDQIHNSGRVVPQRASYNVNNLYRRTTITSGNYPTDSFNMYTGMPWGTATGLTLPAGDGGDTLVSDQTRLIESETLLPPFNKFITVWHKGFWTGHAVNGNFTKQELMSFAVTPTGNDWATGYNMWDTLTVTGKQLFVNAVAGFFID